jgi:hypothetical protein
VGRAGDLGHDGELLGGATSAKLFPLSTNYPQMPATFEFSGIKFLYPDNWTIAERGEDEGVDGGTFELPSGGFFSIERDREGQLFEELVEEIADSLEQDYGEIEHDEPSLDGEFAGEKVVDFRFYYLDLLIVSRLVVLDVAGKAYVIQMQAESRDFDSNELVFAAILKQIRG